jgi:ATP-binding cassette subfamily B protein
MRLPIRYFDSYHTGDTLQRLNDGKRIESFLTGSTLNIFFSFFSFITFATVLILFNVKLFIIYMVGSLLYFLWVRFFLKIRYRLNYENFHISANANNNALQMVQGMQEIKLHGAEQIKRWEWEDLQATSYKLSFKTQSYNQLQQAGSLLIHEGKIL